jgi:hypothetical protein
LGIAVAVCVRVLEALFYLVVKHRTRSRDQARVGQGDALQLEHEPVGTDAAIFDEAI